VNNPHHYYPSQYFYPDRLIGEMSERMSLMERYMSGIQTEKENMEKNLNELKQKLEREISDLKRELGLKNEEIQDLKSKCDKLSKKK
jgi:predicted  nucleic acid-binding Zn-ribbon protein